MKLMHFPEITSPISLLITHRRTKFLHPSPLYTMLLDLLVHTCPDWTSPSWSSMFNSIFNPPSPKTHSKHIHQATNTMSILFFCRIPAFPNHRADPLSVRLIPCTATPALLQQQSIKCYLSGIRYFQIWHSFPDPLILQGHTKASVYMSSVELGPKKPSKTIDHSHASQ